MVAILNCIKMIRVITSADITKEIPGCGAWQMLPAILRILL